MLLCSSLSPVWNFSFHSYSPFKSPYSILPPTEFGEHKFVFKVCASLLLLPHWLREGPHECTNDTLLMHSCTRTQSSITGK